MKKYVLSLLSMFALTLFVASPSNSEMRYGIMGSFGDIETSGTENEESGDKGSDANSTSFEEFFVAASVFAEMDLGDYLVIGVDYMPIGKELGSGQRTDKTTWVGSRVNRTTQPEGESATDSVDSRLLFDVHCNGTLHLNSLRINRTSWDEDEPTDHSNDDLNPHLIVWHLQGKL